MNNDFPEIDTTQDRLKEKVIELNWVKSEIADNIIRRDALQDEIISLLNHKKEGQATYKVSKFKVVVTTGFSYSLDKNKYLELSSQIPAEFNPVTEKVAYYLSASKFKIAQKNADKQTKSILRKLVTTSDLASKITISSAD